MIPHTIPPDAMVPDLYAPSPDENKESYFYGFASHCRVSEAASMGVDINEYNMFGVIRHPVSRIVSAYESKKSYCEREGITEGPIVLGGNFTLERYLDNIEEQIALRSVHGASINGMGVYKGYIWEFYKPGSTLFKLENGLENGFSDYLVSIGGNPMPAVHSRRGNASSVERCIDVYGSPIVSRMEEIFSDDLELWESAE